MLEPITSQIIGVLLNIDLMPGPMTWVGLSLIIIAINIIHRGEVLKNQEENFFEIGT